MKTLTKLAAVLLTITAISALQRHEFDAQKPAK
jgi:hypothetical protein